MAVLQAGIVTTALAFIVFAGFSYATSAGDEKKIEAAKKAVTAAMIGLAIAIAAPTILREIALILGWRHTPDTLLEAPSLAVIWRNVLNFLLGIVGITAVIMLVIGGLMYLLAAGNEDRIDKGKKIVTYSIIGIMVALAAMVIVRQIAAFFTV